MSEIRISADPAQLDDAHDVYERAGFSALVHPQRWMERLFPDVYGAAR
jgi:hypothetical protein